MKLARETLISQWDVYLLFLRAMLLLIISLLYIRESDLYQDDLRYIKLSTTQDHDLVWDWNSLANQIMQKDDKIVKSNEIIIDWKPSSKNDFYNHDKLFAKFFVFDANVTKRMKQLIWNFCPIVCTDFELSSGLEEITPKTIFWN